MSRRLPAYVGWLVGCAVVGGAVGHDRSLAALCAERSCTTALRVRESLLHLDVSAAVVGLVVGLVALVAVAWVRRGR